MYQALHVIQYNNNNTIQQQNTITKYGHHILHSSTHGDLLFPFAWSCTMHVLRLVLQHGQVSSGNAPPHTLPPLSSISCLRLLSSDCPGSEAPLSGDLEGVLYKFWLIWLTDNTVIQYINSVKHYIQSTTKFIRSREKQMQTKAMIDNINKVMLEKAFKLMRNWRRITHNTHWC